MSELTLIDLSLGVGEDSGRFICPAVVSEGMFASEILLRTWARAGCFSWRSMMQMASRFYSLPPQLRFPSDRHAYLAENQNDSDS